MAVQTPSAPRTRRVRRKLPAVLMRAGTSRGLFIQRQYLPADTADWAVPLLAAMGSSHSDKRQIDGVGGATSTTSKVAVVGPSTTPGIDVDYTFVQVAIGSPSVDLSGSCGNMASGVGPFALQEGMVKPKPGDTTVDVSILNTNTGRVIVETVQVDPEDGEVIEDGDYVIAGAKGSGAEIKVSFVEPAGSMTGKLFPTGKRIETLEAEDPDQPGSTFSVEATIIDVANPFILIDQQTFPADVQPLDPGSERFMRYAEAVRRVGAVKMGLATSIEAASLVRGTPKVAMALSPVLSEHDAKADANIQAFSMGKPHPTLQITGAVCIAASVCLPGTVTARLSSPAAPAVPPTPELSDSGSDSGVEPPSEALQSTLTALEQTGEKNMRTLRRLVRVAHPTGVIEIDSQVSFHRSGEAQEGEEETAVVERCAVSRTARRIFEGTVLYYADA